MDYFANAISAVLTFLIMVVVPAPVWVTLFWAVPAVSIAVYAATAAR